MVLLGPKLTVLQLQEMVFREMEQALRVLLQVVKHPQQKQQPRKNGLSQVYHPSTPAADYADAITGDFYYNSTTGQFKTVNTGGAPIGTWSVGGNLNTSRGY